MAKRARPHGNDDEPRKGRTKDPIIEGLFNRLPATGAIWPMAERKAWLTMIEQAFKVIYEEPEPDTSPPGSPPSSRHPTQTA